jgi:predicted O-methyltransferase YrrM
VSWRARGEESGMNIEDLQFQQIFSDAKSRGQLWNRILDSANVKTMVEVGVWKGEFAKQILKNCNSIQRYYMIDPWANLPDWNKPANVKSEVFEDIYAEAIQNTEFASSKIKVLRGRTIEVIDEIEDDSLDFAYIDGDHTLRGITIDLIRILPKVKRDGLIGGDDFINNPWQHKMRFEPTLVCPYSIYFAEAMDFPIIAMPFSQFLIQKRVGGSFSFIDTTGKYGDLSLNKWPNRFRKRKRKQKLGSKVGKK